MQLNKYLAEAGYGSRRGVEDLIRDGNVTINGIVAKLTDRVQENDVVEVNGSLPTEHVYYAYNKPTGVVTVNAQAGEKEIQDVISLPDGVVPVGRLDKESEGLIILTNDGRVSRDLTGENKSIEKEYQVTVDKPINHAFLVGMHSGVNIGSVGSIRNYKTKPVKIRRTSPATFDIILTEGKNRQIRRMCGAFGYAVKKLKRFRIGNLKIGNLRPGQLKEIDAEAYT